MMTIIKAIELSTEYLEKKSVADARINAEILLADILKCKRMDLYLKFDQPLKETEISKYREYIKRRGLREPLQYITGSVEFYGLEFTVNKSVLIPRPETEILVETVINETDKSEEIRILDIGTGSGNIAISLVKNIPNCFIHAIDISDDAIIVAKNNAKKNGLNGRISFETIDFTKYKLSDSIKYNIIISNPPYISKIEYSTLEPELTHFEPQNALTDNLDGYHFYKEISDKAMNLLNKKGKVFFEVGYNQSSKVSTIMGNAGLENIQVKKDYQNIERVLIGEYR